MALSLNKKKEIFKAYREGNNISSLCKQFSISRNTVAKVIKQFSDKDNSEFLLDAPEAKLSEESRERLICQFKDRTLLGLVDYTDIVLRRVKYISALPQNSISNADLKTLHDVLRGLAELDFANKKADSVLETLQAYLFNLKKD